MLPLEGRVAEKRRNNLAQMLRYVYKYGEQHKFCVRESAQVF